MKLSCFSFLLITIFAASAAEARVFSFNDESFAAYLKGSVYPGRMENTLQSGSHGANSTLDAYVPYNLAGEFGFVYARPSMQIRFGMEIIHPLDKKDAAGTNAAGDQLYSLTSELTVIVPKVGLDFTVRSWPQARTYIGATAGYASLAARNSYTFTSAGTSQYGLSDFYEDLRGGTPQYEGLAGYEHIFTDATTMAFEVGYRNLVFQEVKHNRDVTTFQGAVSKGDKALNDDASDRTLNLSQVHFGLNIRFWIK